MNKRIINRLVLSAGLFAVLLAVTFSLGISENPQADDLAGAWKGKVQFKTGAFAGVTNLEFMWVFNDGGTMNESSNYDGAPPVPPAYGIWKKTGEKQYEARYEFYWTQIPESVGDIIKSGGFTPGGYGVLSEKIILSEDGKSYSSTIKYNLFDQNGKQTVFNDEATAEAIRMEF